MRYRSPTHRLLFLLGLVLLLGACDLSGADENAAQEAYATVQVEGGSSYVFRTPGTARIVSVTGAPTQVLSFVLSEQLEGASRLRLDLSVEARELVADSTYVLSAWLDRNRIGQGQSGLHIRFSDCPASGLCSDDYYAIAGPVTPPFVRIIERTDTQVSGAFGFHGLRTLVQGASPVVRGTFRLPLEP
jgi:hypothetical protein